MASAKKKMVITHPHLGNEGTKVYTSSGLTSKHIGPVEVPADEADELIERGVCVEYVEKPTDAEAAS